MDKKPEKIVPEVRFKGFTDDWEQRKLKSISNISSGGTPNKNNKKYWNGNIFWITTSEIHYNQITKSKDTITQLGLDNSSAKIFHPGTILMAMYGQGKTRGQVGLLKTAAATNQAVAAIVPHQIVKTNFLYSFLEKEYLHIRNYANSGSQSNLSLTIIGSQNIIFSKNIVEQSKIGNIFSNISTLITLQQRKLRQLKRLKTAMLQQLFVSKNSKQPVLRFKNFDSDWRPYSLKDISAKTYSGLTGKSKDDFGHGKARYITYLNVHNNEVAVSDGVEQIEVDSKQNKVLKGDLLFTISSEVPSEVALNSVWPFEAGKDIYLNSFCFGIRPKSNYINSFFLTYYLRSPQMRKLIYPLAQGISRFNISKQSILALKINIPVLPEQINIYKVLIHIDNLIALHQNKLTQLTTLKKYLLQKLFI